MKTWQRILVVTILLLTGVTVGLTRLAQSQRDYGLSVTNLKMIGLGVQMYADDNDDKLPDLSDPQTMKVALVIYVSKDKSQAERFFVQPRTGQPYQPNTSLSFQKRTGLIAPSTIAVAFEDEPGIGGTRAVLFVDGHVDRVSEKQWQELKKSSNIL